MITTNRYRLNRRLLQYDEAVAAKASFPLSGSTKAIFVEKIWLGRIMRVISIRYRYSHASRYKRGPCLCFDTYFYSKKREEWSRWRRHEFTMGLDRIEDFRCLLERVIKYLKKPSELKRPDLASRYPIASMDDGYRQIRFDLALRDGPAKSKHWHIVFRTVTDHGDSWHLCLPMTDAAGTVRGEVVARKRMEVYTRALLNAIRICRVLKKRWTERPEGYWRAFKAAKAEELFLEVQNEFNGGREKGFYRSTIPGFDEY